VDGQFSFLDSTDGALLVDILRRRRPQLQQRVQRAGVVSQSAAEEILDAILEEFTSNLDDDWEPTEYGRSVSGLMTRFNEARISQWPE
jgi:hypothetical protein